LIWTYTFLGCSYVAVGDQLVVEIDRGWANTSGAPVALGAKVKVTYPYHWRFNGVIQLLIPGASYAAQTDLQESAIIHSQT
jgi:hypothetical protein